MKLVNIHKLTIVLPLSLLLWTTSNAQQWTLQQCLDTAQVNNKNLQIGLNNEILSQDKQKEVQANLLPKLTANADYKYFTNLPYQLMPLSTFDPTAPEGKFKETQFGVPHNISANLQLAIPLYNPQIYGGIKKSKIAMEMTTLQYEKSKEQIYFEISNLYYNAQILKAQLDFLESNLANANRLLSNLKLLNDQLLATGTDVGKVELQVAQLSTKNTTIQSKLEQVLRAMKFAIGIPTERAFEVETSIVATNQNEYTALPSLDYRLITIQNKLLSSELKTLNNSRYLPSVNLMGSYGTSGFGYDKKPNTFLNFYPIGFAGLQVSYPIFNGTATLHRVHQKKIELQNNELKSSLVDDQNTMQIANANAQRNTSYQAIETSNQQIQLAQKIYSNTLLQQEQGVASLTDVLLADNALREAQQTNLSVIIDYLKADLELKKLTGNL
ncbi:MAG TPA: TolC family protein [Bacteroidetes bacterium]|nr:TolC family protein [Bacteroidota bacterium]